MILGVRDRNHDKEPWSGWLGTGAPAVEFETESEDDADEEEPATMLQKFMTEKAAMQPIRDLGFKDILEAIKDHIVNLIRQCILGQEKTRHIAFFAPVEVLYDTHTREAVLLSINGNRCFTLTVPPKGMVLRLKYIDHHTFSLHHHLDAILSELAENDFAVTFENDKYDSKHICVSW